MRQGDSDILNKLEQLRVSGTGGVTASSTTTFTNKTIDANSNTLTNLSVSSIKDGSDATKVLTFDVSAIPTATTRTLTFNILGHIAKLVNTLADGASITPLVGYEINHQTNTQTAGTLTVVNPSGTASDGQSLTIRLKSTNIQTYAWGNLYRAPSSQALPTVSTAGKTDYISFYYNGTDTTWDLAGQSAGY